MSPELMEGRETPLMLAARFNGVDVVEYLVERGASLDLQDSRGFSASHYAVMGGKTENILRLIELGANILKDSFDNISPVYLAAEHGHARIVQLLLDHGADVKNASIDGTTPITLAAQKGHLETIQVLLKNGCSLHVSDGEGFLPLHHAAAGDHVDVVKFILNNGGNVMAKTGEGDTLLHLATSLELVSFLVEQGVDIHAKDSYGSTPLHAAARKGQTDTVAFLLSHGADINAYDRSGFSALYDAFQSGHGATAKVLIDKGSDVKLTNDESNGEYVKSSLLAVAASRGDTDILELLFQTGLSVKTGASLGQPPLSAAAQCGHLDTVAFLLDRGANINGIDATEASCGKSDSCNEDSDSEDDEENDRGYWTNFQRRSPLYCALEAGHGDIAKLLIERGADTSNKYLAELAARHGLSEILDRLVG